MLVRGSSHIETQAELLRQEQERAKVFLDKPTSWRIAREKREYGMADAVMVLSSFAHRSFVERGFPEEKLRMLPLGSDVRLFQPSRGVIDQRCRRILSGQPLHVLTVGTFSYRKGALDLVEIAKTCGLRFEFQVVGSVALEAV
jgi:glycosyltransferase involved in cell wall biosynthesis